MKQIAVQEHIHNYTTLPTRPREQITGQGHIHNYTHTITQPCLQDHVKQIAGLGPCLQDHVKQIAGQGHIHNYTTLPTRPREADRRSGTHTQLHNPAYKTA